MTENINKEEKNISPGRFNSTARSDVLNDLISKGSSRFERWSFIFFICLFVLLIAGTWFIPYPDTINVKIELHCAKTPVEVVSGKNGFVSNAFAKNKGKGTNSQRPADLGYYAELFIPQRYLSLVKSGQAVQIKLDAYPSQEFGYVTGEIDSIASIPTEGSFIAIVRLRTEFATNRFKTVKYVNGLQGQGKIIISEVRLLEKIYRSLVPDVKTKFSNR